MENLFGWLFLFKLNALARPKSANFRTPLLVIKTLAAFMSLCRILKRTIETLKQGSWSHTQWVETTHFVTVDKIQSIQKLLHDLLDFT